jgi:hypothetical protein
VKCRHDLVKVDEKQNWLHHPFDIFQVVESFEQEIRKMKEKRVESE